MLVLLRFIRIVGVTALFSVASFAAHAELYPAKQVTILPVGSSPEDFEAFMRAEAAKWGPILKQANVRIE